MLIDACRIGACALRALGFGLLSPPLSIRPGPPRAGPASGCLEDRMWMPPDRGSMVVPNWPAVSECLDY